MVYETEFTRDLLGTGRPVWRSEGYGDTTTLVEFGGTYYLVFVDDCGCAGVASELDGEPMRFADAGSALRWFEVDPLDRAGWL